MDTKTENNWKKGADEQYKVTYMQKRLYNKWFQTYLVLLDEDALRKVLIPRDENV